MPPSPTCNANVPDTPPQPAAEPIASDATRPDAPASAEPPVPVAPSVASPATADGAPAAAAIELTPVEVAARLAELFPALFAAIPNTPPRPIKLRIQTDIQQRAPGLFSRRSLSPFLHRHTTTSAYLKALVASPHRYDLDGVPAGEVSDEHRQAAVAELDRRRAIVESRRAAERQARHTAARAAGPRDAAAPAADASRPAGPDRRDTRPRPPRRAPPHQSRRGQASSPTEHMPVPPRAAAHARVPVQTWPLTPQPVEPPMAEPAQPPDDAARRERAQLLRAFESSTLSRANFCALKRIDPAALDATLEQARREAPKAAPQARPADTRRPPNRRAPR